MKFQITRTIRGNTKTLRNPINLKCHTFDTREDAQAFADSCFAVALCDYKNQGRKLPTFLVVEAA